jgi:hypothetical protein
MDNKERLIDYLYGEMAEAERHEFEQLLARDHELQAELEVLSQTRQRLAEMPEVRPEATVLTVAAPRIFWKKWGLRVGVAAIAVLLLSLANARLEVGTNGLVFTIGKPAPPIEMGEVENGTELLATLQNRFSKRDRELDEKLLQLDSIWQNRLVKREEQLQQSWDSQLSRYQSRRQQELQQFVKYLVSEEMPDLVTLVQHLQLEQQEELQVLLSRFWNEWQDTRAADMKSIETEFVNLYKNVEFNQTETEAILKDVLTSR